MLESQPSHHWMLYILWYIASPAHIVTRPPCAKLRAYTLQISYQMLEPFFISKTSTISTEFCQHFLRYLFPLRIVYMTTQRINKYAPDSIIVIWWHRFRQREDMIGGGIPGEKIPTTTNNTGRNRIERFKHTV